MSGIKSHSGGHPNVEANTARTQEGSPGLGLGLEPLFLERTFTSEETANRTWWF